jgi:hypothetical protein
MQTTADTQYNLRLYSSRTSRPKRNEALLVMENLKLVFKMLLGAPRHRGHASQSRMQSLSCCVGENRVLYPPIPKRAIFKHSWRCLQISEPRLPTCQCNVSWPVTRLSKASYKDAFERRLRNSPLRTQVSPSMESEYHASNHPHFTVSRLQRSKRAKRCILII